MASGQLPKFTRNDQWPSDSPEPLTTIPEAYHKLHPKSISELKEALQVIWDTLPLTDQQGC